MSGNTCTSRYIFLLNCLFVIVEQIQIFVGFWFNLDHMLMFENKIKIYISRLYLKLGWLVHTLKHSSVIRTVIEGRLDGKKRLRGQSKVNRHLGQCHGRDIIM